MALHTISVPSEAVRSHFAEGLAVHSVVYVEPGALEGGHDALMRVRILRLMLVIAPICVTLIDKKAQVQSHAGGVLGPLVLPIVGHVVIIFKI